MERFKVPLNSSCTWTENDLVRAAKKWWNSKMNNVTYCNKKIDHINRVVDRVIAFAGRASGL